LQQVIFTTELLYASDGEHSVVGGSVTKPVIPDVENATSGCEDKSSCIEGSSVQHNTFATETASARTSTSKPLKIVFKDYYASSVSSPFVRFQIKHA